MNTYFNQAGMSTYEVTSDCDGVEKGYDHLSAARRYALQAVKAGCLNVRIVENKTNKIIQQF